MTHIYYAQISRDQHGLLMRKYSKSFSDKFMKKLLRYRRWQDAQLSMLGRLLLKYGFEKNNESFSDEDVVFSEYNKPILENHPLQFNISHSGNIAICVISDVAEVGVDIEQMQEIDVEDYKFQMTEGEWKRVTTAELVKDAFFDYWTQKEAVLKANGKGLMGELNSFEVIDDNSEIDDEVFYLKKIFIVEDYKCHLAFKNKTESEMMTPEKVVFT